MKNGGKTAKAAKNDKNGKKRWKTAKNCEKWRKLFWGPPPSFFCPGYRTAAQLHEVNQPWLHSRPPSSSPWSWIWTWTRWPWVEVAREGEQVHRCQDIKVCPLSFSTPSYHWSNYVANHNVCTYLSSTRVNIVVKHRMQLQCKYEG